MRYQIPIERYATTIDAALAFLAERPGSGGAEGMADLLAAVWDPILPIDLFATLTLLDLLEREIALDLIVGRFCWGQPIDHPKAKTLEAMYWERSLTRERHSRR